MAKRFRHPGQQALQLQREATAALKRAFTAKDDRHDMRVYEREIAHAAVLVRRAYDVDQYPNG